LCGYYGLQPIACERRDPESKGIVEGGVRYVKHNALAGRGEELTRFETIGSWPPVARPGGQRADARDHPRAADRPLWARAPAARALPVIPFDTDEIVPAVVTPHARIEFDGNRYSTPPSGAPAVTIRASADEVRVLSEGRSSPSTPVPTSADS